MAGLLAGCMLRSDCFAIIEAQLSLPNNHSALLRFRSSIVGDTLGIPFKKVSVMKSVAPWRNPLADALAYAKKGTGQYTLRSSLSARSEMEDRYIAPSNLIEMMAHRVQAPIELGQPVTFQGSPGPVISTIPMPHLMHLLNYDGERPMEFPSVKGANMNVELEGVDAYGTLYVPNPEIPFNRISITGSRLTIEFAGMDAAQVAFDEGKHLMQALTMLGMKVPGYSPSVTVGKTEISDQKYAKILPIDEGIRKRFILWASEKHNVYSLGRFATWRPKVLLDDVVNDVRVIQSIIAHGSYDHRK